MKNIKKTIYELNKIANKVCNREIKQSDNLFIRMDSLELMNFFTQIEKKFKKKIKIAKLLDMKKLDISDIYKELN